MEKSNYNRGGVGDGRGRGGGSGCGRGGSGGGGRGCNNYKQYHQSRYQSRGGAGNSGGGGANNCQQHNQGRYQSGGYGRRGGRGVDRSGTQMGTNPPPAQSWGERTVQGGQGGPHMGTNPPPVQPWGYRPVHGGRGGTDMGTNPPPAQPWGYRLVQDGQGGTQWPESAMGQAAVATGGSGTWIGGPPHVARRGSWASAVGVGAGAGQAQRGILFMFLFPFVFLFLFYQTLPAFIVFVAENVHHAHLFLENQRGDVGRNISPGQCWIQKLFNHLSMISAIMKILEQASGHTTTFSMMSIISHLICCRSSYTSYASPLLNALSLSPLSHQFTMLPSLTIGDEWICSLLLQLRHQLLSHHDRLHLRLHLTISSDFLCSQ